MINNNNNCTTEKQTWGSLQTIFVNMGIRVSEKEQVSIKYKITIKKVKSGKK